MNELYILLLKSIVTLSHTYCFELLVIFQIVDWDSSRHSGQLRLLKSTTLQVWDKYKHLDSDRKPLWIWELQQPPRLSVIGWDKCQINKHALKNTSSSFNVTMILAVTIRTLFYTVTSIKDRLIHSHSDWISFRKQKVSFIALYKQPVFSNISNRFISKLFTLYSV